ncbi:hypothetical protein H206_06164 [Candidatus Electrothrix aarhusensis]|uniref:Uncharacterized protein n=1 Tax=Candidatus Electrothrix aarhusensis TaxID=1859131 RepID=A0A444J377_9BACT|nr:hypothetical protein H206_06164 [Candidatus Electrothrix aarhusensis]
MITKTRAITASVSSQTAPRVSPVTPPIFLRQKKANKAVTSNTAKTARIPCGPAAAQEIPLKTNRAAKALSRACCVSNASLNRLPNPPSDRA